MLSDLKDLLSTPLSKKILIVGLLLMSCLFGLIRIQRPNAETYTPSSYISLLQHQSVDSSTAIEEQAILFDTEPIILPTLWNASKRPTQILRQRDEITPFQSFEPVITLTQSTLFPSSLDTTTSLSPQATLKTDYWQFCSHFAQEPKTTTPLDSRQSLIHIKNLKSDQVLTKQDLNSPNLQEPMIEKLDFLTLITPYNLSSRTLRLNTTGSDEIDMEAEQSVQAQVEKSDLRPGYYRISVGP